MPRKRVARPGGPSPTDPWSPAASDAEYAWHRQHAHDRLQWRRLQAAKRATQARVRLAALPPGIRSLVEATIARARSRRTANRERLLQGFHWPGGHVNNQAFAPFVATRLRSDLHPILRLFVARTPRAGRGLRSGIDKALLRGPLHDSKLLHLDQPYASFTAAMRGIIRIDLDRIFASWEALGEAVRDAGLPLPNLAVARVDGDGRVVHPHAYWLLAEAVCWTGKGRRGPCGRPAPTRAD